MIASRSRRGTPTLPSRQRRRAKSVTDTSVNRRNVNPTGGSTPIADFTTMKLPAHRTMTARTPASARVRSVADTARAAGAPDTETPAASAAGVDGFAAPEGAARVAISGAFAIELEDLLLVLLGQLQPDEQPGEHDQRDDDERGEGDAQRDRDRLQCLHRDLLLRVGMPNRRLSRPAWDWEPGRGGGGWDRGRPSRRCRRG